MDEEEFEYVGKLLEEGGLSHSEIDTYFEHAGVKGMKWGVRREQARAANQKRNETIDWARRYVKSGAAKKDLAENKAAYAIDKRNVGRAHAKEVFIQTRDPIYKLANYSAQAKSGRETTILLLSGNLGLQAYHSITGKGPGLKEVLPGGPLHNYASRNQPKATRFSSSQTKLVEIQKLRSAVL